MNVIEIPLGTQDQLTPLFSYRPQTESLADSIEHTFNQTLLRDSNFGSWARVLTPPTTNPQFRLKITSPNPNANLTLYKTVILSFLGAVATAASAFTKSGPALLAQQQAMIKANPKLTPAMLSYSFLPPFGLAMAKTTSVQLLHYPPTETLTYMDYLYSPTNRRWESLLAFNVDPNTKRPYVAGHNACRLETIVDIAPIAAPGGGNGATLIDPVLQNFVPYVTQMLRALLRPTTSGKSTQPVVAYGAPVRTWLYQNFKTQIDQQLEQPQWFANQSYAKNSALPQAPTKSLYVLALLSLPLLDGGPPTPVLCANHPSMFFHNAGLATSGTPTDTNAADEQVVIQDLVAAGWQSQMSLNPEGDPVATLQAVFGTWANPSPERQAIIDAQVEEFSYVDAPGFVDALGS